MNGEFDKYIELRNAGRSAAEAYRVAQAAQAGELFSVRMLRTVYGLSLPEAKRISGVMERISSPQVPAVGKTVYWEGSDTVEGTWIMEATVARIDDDLVHVEGHRKFLVRPEGLVEVPATSVLTEIPLSYFSKSLVDRLSEAAGFWRDLIEA